MSFIQILKAAGFKLLRSQCAVCGNDAWRWQECKGARYSNEMDEAPALPVEAIHSLRGKPLTRAASQ